MSTKASTAPDSLLDRLYQWRETYSDRQAWSFLDDRGNLSVSYTYKQLDEASTALANELMNKHKLTTSDNHRVLLVFFPGLHFTISLLACFKAGITAIPVFPPDPRKLKKDLHHFVSIQASSGAVTALTHKDYNFAKNMAGAKSMFSFSSGGETWPELSWITVDSILETGKKSSTKTPLKYPPSYTQPTSDSIAFLQYTSGSTSEPKGVMISHANLAHNLSIIVDELQANVDTINVSWLPQYHDMGLIGSYLGLIYCGGKGYYLSPISFLKDATVWLQTLSKYKGTHTQAPNFAYALSTRKFKEALRSGSKIELDLGAVQHMINAAEPVDVKAISEFYKLFSGDKYKLPHNVVIPTYGLAEHCVFVCSAGKQVLTIDSKAFINDKTITILSSQDMAEPANIAAAIATNSSHNDKRSNSSQIMVGCGYPSKHDVDVRIVDPDTRKEVKSGEIGEIWVNSPSKAQGYWNMAVETQELFNAKIETTTTSNDGNDGNDGNGSENTSTYLRTGDMGFFHLEELFICGRIKDLIIIRGSNHYPQDIERSVESALNKELRAGCTAAFTIKGDQYGDAVTMSGVGKRGGGKGVEKDGSDSMSNDTECLVYIAEVQASVKPSQYEAIVEIIKSTISEDHGVAASLVILVTTKTITKTTSGKITRAGACKAMLGGGLSVVYQWYSSAAAVGSTSTTSGSGEKAITSSDVIVRHKGDTGDADDGGEEEDEDEERNAMIASFPALSPEELQSMERKDILDMIRKLLIAVSIGSPNEIDEDVEDDVPLRAMGLDSMTIVQFKGLLDARYNGSSIPDEFMMTSLAHLNGVSLALKVGGLTAEQQQKYDNAMEGIQGEDDEDVEVYKEPYCPWWTCC